MDLLPFDAEAQRRVACHWLATVRDRTPAVEVRSVVRASWGRSLMAEVPPALAQAPVVLDRDSLQDAVDSTDWLGLARTTVHHHRHSFTGEGHILALFDHRATMLAAEGDPAALDGLGEINFRPGGWWAETAVGTNGPGTALATGQPAHIVGTEHFCERWQRWHCAAVPIREAAGGRVLGVLDISGFREQAHPHTLNLALALALAIEQCLAARQVERRYLVLSRLNQLTARYPRDPALALDHRGRLLAASPGIPDAWVAGTADAIARTVRGLVGRTTDGLACEVPVPVGADRWQAAVWYPVTEGRTVVGGCLLLDRRPPLLEADPRRAGVTELARAAFAMAARELGRLRVEVEPEVFAALEACEWPGGEAELRRLVRRVAAGAGGRVTLTDLPRRVRAAYYGIRSAQAPSAVTAAAVLAGESAADREDARLVEAVNSSRTMAEAAARLGITRSTLYRRLERSGLKPRRTLSSG